jgi:PAS domain-containing protein
MQAAITCTNILYTTRNGVIAADDAGRIVLANPQAAEILGLVSGKIITRHEIPNERRRK